MRNPLLPSNFDLLSVLSLVGILLLLSPITVYATEVEILQDGMVSPIITLPPYDPTNELETSLQFQYTNFSLFQDTVLWYRIDCAGATWENPTQLQIGFHEAKDTSKDGTSLAQQQSRNANNNNNNNLPKLETVSCPHHGTWTMSQKSFLSFLYMTVAAPFDSTTESQIQIMASEVFTQVDDILDNATSSQPFFLDHYDDTNPDDTTQQFQFGVDVVPRGTALECQLECGNSNNDNNNNNNHHPITLGMNTYVPSYNGTLAQFQSTANKCPVTLQAPPLRDETPVFLIVHTTAKLEQAQLTCQATNQTDALLLTLLQEDNNNAVTDDDDQDTAMEDQEEEDGNAIISASVASLPLHKVAFVAFHSGFAGAVLWLAGFLF